MDRPVLLLSLASVGGIFLMAAVAHTSEPPLVAFSDLARWVGNSVRTDGRVLEPQFYDSGFTRFLLSNDNRTATVNLREALDLSAGDQARVEARVLEAGQSIVLELDSASDVTVLVPWRENHVPLSKLVANAWHYEGANVRTSGILEHKGTTASLADPTSTTRIGLIQNGLAWSSSGAHVLVDGILEYEPEGAAFRLRPTHLERAAAG